MPVDDSCRFGYLMSIIMKKMGWRVPSFSSTFLKELYLPDLLVATLYEASFLSIKQEDLPQAGK